MGIMEAKFESSQRTLEAELQSRMEKEVCSSSNNLYLCSVIKLQIVALVCKIWVWRNH